MQFFHGMMKECINEKYQGKGYLKDDYKKLKEVIRDWSYFVTRVTDSYKSYEA